MKNCLIAFYSRKGRNFYGGRIMDLPVGNTEIIARKIQELTGGTIFEIKTVKSYPEDYTETTEVSKIELRNNARPELSELLPGIEQYDTVFLGYPNWWGTMPMAVFTFLESYDFAGKTIVPFCTHEGSGMGRSEKDIRGLCGGAMVLQGIAIRGSSVNRANADIEKWLNENKII